MRFAKSFGENETSACWQRTRGGRTNARPLDDLPPAIGRWRCPGDGQNLCFPILVVFARQRDPDRASLQNDAVDAGADALMAVGQRVCILGRPNVIARRMAIRMDGFRCLVIVQAIDPLHNAFLDLRRRNPRNRSGVCLVAAKDRLRDIIAPTLRSPLRPTRCHQIAPVIEQLADQQRVRRLALATLGFGCEMALQALLDPTPKLTINDRRVLAFVDKVSMGDLADIDRVGEDLVDMASAEATASSRSPLAVDADGKTNVLSVEHFL